MRKIKNIVEKYDACVKSLTKDGEGYYQVGIDENFYYVEQYKMERELMALGTVNSIFYHKVNY